MLDSLKSLWSIAMSRRPANDDDLTLIYAREIQAYVLGLDDDIFARKINEGIEEWKQAGQAERRSDLLLPKLLSYEIRLVNGLAPAELWRSYWLVREWFGRVASARSIAAHDATQPAKAPPPGATPDNESVSLMRADQISMLRYIYKAYAVNCEREDLHSDLKRWIQYRLFVDCGAALLIYIGVYAVLVQWFSTTAPMHISKDFLFGLLLIGIAGYAGAAMSTVRRLQGLVDLNALDRDPFIEMVAMRRGRSGIRLGLMSGSVFAILLYIFFASGVASQIGIGGDKAGIFPQSSMLVPDQVLAAQRGREMGDRQVRAILTATQTAPFTEATTAGDEKPAMRAGTPVAVTADERAKTDRHRCYLYAGPSCGWVANLSGRLGFYKPADFFLMLLWAFIAGFAERLVPDAIDRTVKAATRDRKEG